MNRSLTPVSGEVLPASLSKKEADAIERRARTAFHTMEKTSILFAMELRRLQEGGAHLVRGYPNFGAYIEATFEGVSASNAAAISRQGRVLLVLEKHGRINPGMDVGELPGTTAVRSLAKILKDLGEEVMLSIYDRAVEYGRKVTDETVLAATRELVAPRLHELGEGSKEPEEDQPEEDELGLTEETSDLLDKIGQLRDLLDEVSGNVLDGNYADARGALNELIEESQKIGTNLD